MNPDFQNIDNQAQNKQNASINEEDGVLRVNMSEQSPLNDPNCKHKDVVQDKTEELGDAYFCPDCRIGWILAK